MRITCSSCHTTYQIADEKVPEKGAHANCPSCGHQILIPTGGAFEDGSEFLPGEYSGDPGHTITFDFQTVDQSSAEVSTLLKQVSEQSSFLSDGVRYHLMDVRNGQKFPIQRPEFTIGRSGCDIALSDPEVSRRHCSLKIYGDRIVIIDMESTNGTFFREKKVLTAKIEPGERFRVGNTTLKLVMERDQ
ncbi:MAG: zinc-ribbon domain-containing protein [bacterium]|nr:MAG: zinc-ribbon domain-containing protein [bacterium]